MARIGAKGTRYRMNPDGEFEEVITPGLNVPAVVVKKKRKGKNLPSTKLVKPARVKARSGGISADHAMLAIKAGLSTAKKKTTAGMLTLALRKLAAKNKKVEGLANQRIYRPAPAGEARAITSYSVRFFRNKKAVDSPPLKYFTVRAAASDAKSLLRSVVGPGYKIYEMGYKGWQEGANFDVIASILGGNSSKEIPSLDVVETTPIEEAPASLQEEAMELKSNPIFGYKRKIAGEKKKATEYITPKVMKGTAKRPAARGGKAIWENVRMTNGKDRMFQHPAMYVAQQGSSVIAAVITEDTEYRGLVAGKVKGAMSGEMPVVKKGNLSKKK